MAVVERNGGTASQVSVWVCVWADGILFAYIQGKEGGVTYTSRQDDAFPAPERQLEQFSDAQCAGEGRSLLPPKVSNLRFSADGILPAFVQGENGRVMCSWAAVRGREAVRGRAAYCGQAIVRDWAAVRGRAAVQGRRLYVAKRPFVAGQLYVSRRLFETWPPPRSPRLSSRTRGVRTAACHAKPPLTRAACTTTNRRVPSHQSVPP